MPSGVLKQLQACPMSRGQLIAHSLSSCAPLAWGWPALASNPLMVLASSSPVWNATNRLSSAITPLKPFGHCTADSVINQLAATQKTT